MIRHLGDLSGRVIRVRLTNDTNHPSLSDPTLALSISPGPPLHYYLCHPVTTPRSPTSRSLWTVALMFALLRILLFKFAKRNQSGRSELMQRLQEQMHNYSFTCYICLLGVHGVCFLKKISHRNVLSFLSVL